MNTQMLYKICNIIMKHPERFDMHFWHSRTVCGTSHCIAGWAEVLTYGERPHPATWEDHLNAPWPPDPEEIGCEVLDLTHAQGKRLFHVEYWPIKFQKER